MDFSSQQQAQTIIATLDAEKAFDRVNWSFLISTMQKFGFGESFIIGLKFYTQHLRPQ